MSYEEKIKIYQSMIRNLEKELKNYEGTPYFEDEEFKIRERINMHKEELRLYSQATKADEYEAKAKAWDKLSVSIRECNKEIELKGGLNAMFRTSKKGQIVQRHIDCFESGESDAKK